MKRRHLFSLPLLALLLLVGCSSKTAGSKVSGKVTYNGAPVTGGIVSFHSEQGVYSKAIQTDGTYEIVDMPAGEFTVTVDTEVINPNIKKQTYTGQSSGGAGKYGKGGAAPSAPKGKGQEVSPAGEGSPQAEAGNYVKIPRNYADKTKTDLKKKVEGGSQTINLELHD